MQKLLSTIYLIRLTLYQACYPKKYTKITIIPIKSLIET